MGTTLAFTSIYSIIQYPNIFNNYHVSLSFS